VASVWSSFQTVVGGSFSDCFLDSLAKQGLPTVSLRTPGCSHCNSPSVPCEKHSWRDIECSPAMPVHIGRNNGPVATSFCGTCHRTNHDSLIGVSPSRCEDVLESDGLENDVGEVDDVELRSVANPKCTNHVCVGTKPVSPLLAVAADCV